VSEVGVVIATRNRRASVLWTLDRLAELPEQPPLVLVDNASTDGTPGAVRRRHPDVKVVELDANAGGAARNAGVSAHDTPLVAFSDDDSWWAPGALWLAAEQFERSERLGLLAARVLVGPEQRLDATCAAMRRSPLPREPGLPGPAVLGFLACGAVVRRSAFLSVGGFHPRLGVGGEESLLALDLAAAGWQLAYSDDVVAYHHPGGGGARAGRRGVQARNALWTAWLRRPARRALARTVALAAHPAALFEAARGLPWVVRERRTLPRGVERAARAIERGPSSAA
jgi:GT2 family glycosyltransferase